MSVSLAREIPNTVVIRNIKIYFRQYPGPNRGGDTGAIAGASYVLRTGDSSTSGSLTSEGKVIVGIPVGETVQLEVFGTTYDLSLQGTLEAHTTIAGCKRRLLMLGYRSGPPDAQVNARTDMALLDYQADHDLGVRGFDNNGHVPADTQNSLRTVVGE
jgi:hypothetical protein